MVADSLTLTGNLFLQPLYQLWVDFVSVFPSIVVALLMLIIGYFIAYGVGHFFRWLLEKAGVNKYMKEAMFSKEFGHTNLPSLVGEIVKWFVFLVFLQVAVSVLNLNPLNDVLDSFVSWLPNLIVAIIIFVVGVALAHYVDKQVRMHTQMRGMLVMVGILKVVILFLVLLVGLKQIGVQVGVLENSFLILLGALGLGFALALGIGLGMGLKGEAQGWVKTWKKKF